MAVCAIKYCSNRYYGLKRWKDEQYRKKKFSNCTGQGTTLVSAHRHIKLFAFPSAITDDDGRNCWIKLVCLTFTQNDSATVS